MGVYMCMCAHNLLDSAQKLEDGHDVCCACVVCIYVACTWHVFIVWVLLGSPVV